MSRDEEKVSACSGRVWQLNFEIQSVRLVEMAEKTYLSQVLLEFFPQCCIHTRQLAERLLSEQMPSAQFNPLFVRRLANETHGQEESLARIRRHQKNMIQFLERAAGRGLESSNERDWASSLLDYQGVKAFIHPYQVLSCYAIDNRFSFIQAPAMPSEFVGLDELFPYLEPYMINYYCQITRNFSPLQFQAFHEMLSDYRMITPIQPRETRGLFESRLMTAMALFCLHVEDICPLSFREGGYLSLLKQLAELQQDMARLVEEMKSYYHQLDRAREVSPHFWIKSRREHYYNERRQKEEAALKEPRKQLEKLADQGERLRASLGQYEDLWLTGTRAGEPVFPDKESLSADGSEEDKCPLPSVR